MATAGEPGHDISELNVGAVDQHHVRSILAVPVQELVGVLPRSLYVDV